MILNIPLSEANKVRKGDEFYTIKLILKTKYRTKRLNEGVLTRKDSTTSFEIISYSAFDNMHDALNEFNFKLFDVANTKEDTFRYYRKLNGQRSPKKWITVVFKLKEI